MHADKVVFANVGQNPLLPFWTGDIGQTVRSAPASNMQHVHWIQSYTMCGRITYMTGNLRPLPTRICCVERLLFSYFRPGLITHATPHKPINRPTQKGEPRSLCAQVCMCRICGMCSVCVCVFCLCVEHRLTYRPRNTA